MYLNTKEGVLLTCTTLHIKGCLTI